MRTGISILCAMLAATVFAKPAVQDGVLLNFQPGYYVLSKGELNLCGEGNFRLRDKATNLGLGDLHGFDTSAKSEAIPGDAPGDGDCVYFAQDFVETHGGETRLGFTEERKCAGKSKHILHKKLSIRKGAIWMDVRQSGADGAMNYSCIWKFQSVRK